MEKRLFLVPGKSMLLIILFTGTYILVDKTFQPLCKRPCSLVSEFTGWCALFVVVVNTQELVIYRGELVALVSVHVGASLFDVYGLFYFPFYPVLFSTKNPGVSE